MSNVMLSKSGDNQHSCPVFSLNGGRVQSFTIQSDVFHMPCIRLRKVLFFFIANLLGNFIMNVEFSQTFLIW